MAVNINVPSQVKTYANLAAFPATGALKTIYIAEDTNKTYRWTGSVYVEVSASASGITIGSTAIASGVVGRVLFEGAGNVVQESSSLFWDDTNARLGIGTSSPTAPLTIKFTGQTGQDFYISGSGSNTHNIGGGNTLNIVHPNITAGASFGTAYGSVNRYFSIGSSFNLNARLAVLGGGTTSATSSFLVLNNSSTELFRIRDNGNVLINTTTDAGFKLDVNGTARVQGNTTIFGNQLRLILRDTIAGPTFHGIDFKSYNDTLVASLIVNQSSGEFRLAPAAGGYFQTFYSNGSERMRIPTTGNVLINTTTDAGFRLDVNGSGRFNNEFILNRSDGVEMFRMNNSPAVLTFNGNNSSTPTLRFHSQSNILFYLKASENRIGINTTTPNASAIMDVTSTTQGFLPPRMTTTQKNAIASPAAGLMVYDTTLNVISYYNGSMWI